MYLTNVYSHLKCVAYMCHIIYVSPPHIQHAHCPHDCDLGCVVSVRASPCGPQDIQHGCHTDVTRFRRKCVAYMIVTLDVSPTCAPLRVASKKLNTNATRMSQGFDKTKIVRYSAKPRELCVLPTRDTSVLLWRYYPSRHETLNQCCFDVGPTSKTVGQH